MKHLRIPFLIFAASVILNACQKEYSIETPFLGVTTGSWQFSNGTIKYSGDMDTVYQTKAGSINELILIGATANRTQNFSMQLFADSFKVGTYKASAFQSSFTYSSPGENIYQAGQLIGEFIVNITSITNNTITGTFSGSALDSTNNVIQLTSGSFTSTFASGSVNPSSTGVLGDSSGNCKPVTFLGTYALGVPTTSSNTVGVSVTVTVPGPFTISTNTINGLSFSRSGTFAIAGPQNVILYATGTPTAAGNDVFTLQYGNSQCAFTLPVLGKSVGTLGNTADACTPFTLNGTYQQGIAFNTGNTVQVQVNITTPGSYQISTDSVNGVRFSGSGIFPTPGLQNVTLTGDGTPLNMGLQNFSVTFGTSTCGFPITFQPAVAASGDYFPLSLNSNWNYDLVGGTSADEITYKVINYSPTFGAESYQTIQQSQTQTDNITDSLYYRKPGGNYYEYVDFSKVFGFDYSVESEFIFLKDNVGATATWTSPTITGTIRGAAVSGYAQMTILAQAVAVTSIPGYTFPDVIEVQYQYFITGNPNPILTQERWFAKNQGEIYFSSNNGTVNSVYEVSTYQVF
ncbi:MAG TPA: hypothetical protein VMU83_01040 [Hanamia sp.]|nr:hypothetical protein [Hanamia sp.]